MTYANRTDSNQAQIVAALREAGATVASLTRQKRGLPDLLVGYRGYNFLLEVKTAGGKLTPDESEFFDSWKGACCIVHSPVEAVTILERFDLRGVDESHTLDSDERAEP